MTAGQMMLIVLLLVCAHHVHQARAAQLLGKLNNWYYIESGQPDILYARALSGATFTVQFSGDYVDYQFVGVRPDVVEDRTSYSAPSTVQLVVGGQLFGSPQNAQGQIPTFDRYTGMLNQQPEATTLRVSTPYAGSTYKAQSAIVMLKCINDNVWALEGPGRVCKLPPTCDLPSTYDPVSVTCVFPSTVTSTDEFKADGFGTSALTKLDCPLTDLVSLTSLGQSLDFVLGAAFKAEKLSITISTPMPGLFLQVWEQGSFVQEQSLGTVLTADVTSAANGEFTVRVVYWGPEVAPPFDPKAMLSSISLGCVSNSKPVFVSTGGKLVCGVPTCQPQQKFDAAKKQCVDPTVLATTSVFTATPNNNDASKTTLVATSADSVTLAAFGDAHAFDSTASAKWVSHSLLISTTAALFTGTPAGVALHVWEKVGGSLTFVAALDLAAGTTYPLIPSRADGTFEFAVVNWGVSSVTFLTTAIRFEVACVVGAFAGADVRECRAPVGGDKCLYAAALGLNPWEQWNVFGVTQVTVDSAQGKTAGRVAGGSVDVSGAIHTGPDGAVPHKGARNAFSVSSPGPVTVHGAVSGSIEALGKVTLGDGATVGGDIHTLAAVAAGTGTSITGTVYSKDGYAAGDNAQPAAKVTIATLALAADFAAVRWYFEERAAAFGRLKDAHLAATVASGELRIRLHGRLNVYNVATADLGFTKVVLEGHPQGTLVINAQSGATAALAGFTVEYKDASNATTSPTFGRVLINFVKQAGTLQLTGAPGSVLHASILAPRAPIVNQGVDVKGSVIGDSVTTSAAAYEVQPFGTWARKLTPNAPKSTRAWTATGARKTECLWHSL